MYSPVFPSSPICDQSFMRTTFSSSPVPRRRTRTLSIGAAAFRKLKSVGKLANATFCKLSSQSLKSAPVRKLPPAMCSPVTITVEPFISFLQSPDTDDPFAPAVPWPSAQEELLDFCDASSTGTDTRGLPLDGTHTVTQHFDALRLTHADQPPSLCSSPTASTVSSTRTSQHTRSDCEVSPLSSLSDRPPPHRHIASIDHPPAFPASTPYPLSSVPSFELLGPVSSYHSVHNTPKTVGPGSAPHYPSCPIWPIDHEPWRQYIHANSFAADASFVPYEFLRSPPVKTRRIGKRPALRP